YSLPPDSPRLEPLRDDYWAHVNNKDLPAIYPPAAQIIFRIIGNISYNLYSLKLLFILLDVGTVLLLWRLLQLRGRSRLWAYVYAWNPLVVFETAGNGHFDGVMIFFLVLSLLWIEQGRWALSALALALGALIKMVPLALLPYYFWKNPRRSHWLLLVPVVIALGYLPFLSAGKDLFFALHQYVTRWRHNDFIFTILHESVFQNLDTTKLVLSVILALYAAYLWGGRREPIAAGLPLFGLAILFSPIVHPWYLLVLVPFLCFRPDAGFLVFTATVVLSYANLPAYHATGYWEENLIAKSVEYFSVFAIWVGLFVHRIAGRRAANPNP
ncbi:MAG: glycosyltransferase 87 family protein, partial [bacterium]